MRLTPDSLMRHIFGFGVLVLFLTADLPLAAQYPPGPYPGGPYPGGYPPGGCAPGYPCGGGGAGIPLPGRHKKNKDDQQPLQSVNGMLRQLNDKRIIMEAEDTRLLDFKRQDSTKFLKDGDPLKPDVLKPGDHLTIEYRQDDEGFMTAVNVTFEKEGTAAEREHASQPVDIVEPVSQSKSGDDDRPVLRRNDSKKDEASNQDAQQPAQPAAQTPTAQANPAATPSAAPAPTAQTGAVGTSTSQTPAATQSAQTAPAATPPGTPAGQTPAGQNGTPAATAPANLPPVAPPDAGLDLDHIPANTSSNPPMDASDSGPPKLKFGKPKPKKSTDADEADDSQVAQNSPPPAVSNQPAASAQPTAQSQTPQLMIAQANGPAPEQPTVFETGPPVDARIEKARNAVGSFSETLPDYLCQEQMARFQSDTPKVSWTPLDIVSMELVYENGKERYRSLQINGKAAKAQRIEDLGGSWSTGEFASVLLDVFSPATAADFRYRHTSRNGGRESYLYDFTVDHEHSHWQIHMASQSILPAYKGSIWIDKETARILRIEMQAVHLPEEFPLDQIEMATDYEFIRIADREFLLPVHSENLMCQRGTSMCSHNVIDFRNYHKYTGEATIEFGK